MATPRQVIASAMDDENMMYADDNANADIILTALSDAGFIIAPKEATDAMIAGGLQASLDVMKETGVDGLSPFSEYPSPSYVTKRAYAGMIGAVNC